MKKILPKTQFIRPRHLFLIFLVLAVLMFSSALIELHQSKKELMELLEDQAHTLSETVFRASRNTLSTNVLVESLIEDRLLNNASIIRELYEQGNINDEFLKKFARENNLFRINIFNSGGEKLFSSHEDVHDYPESSSAPDDILEPIFSGQADTLLIGLKAARFERGYRYAVAVASEDHSAIVVNMNADKLLKFRRQIGFGSLLQQMSQNPGILYSALQDTIGILAASGNVQQLDRINSSKFLSQSMQDSLFKTRITDFDTIKVFEAVQPLHYQGEFIGLFRLGLSLEPMSTINSRIYRRIIIISVILLIIGFVLFTFLIVRQNLEIVNKQYQNVETYSQNIIQNVNDAIIVFQKSKGVQIFNHAAEKIFEVDADGVIGKPLTAIFTGHAHEEIVESDFTLKETEFAIKGNIKNLLLSKNVYTDVNQQPTTILVVRDLTDEKRLEAQIQRQERLSALGQLASGVAHEIRNPLNAISTVIQQLKSDFRPSDNYEEYRDLTGMVHQEVKRINQTIQNFLRFARPEPLNPELFELKKFFEVLSQEYSPLLKKKNIKFRINLKWNGTVEWDRHKMQQLFVNLLENSIQSFSDTGEIEITVSQKQNDQLLIEFSDTGPGIPKEIQAKIFNLYFSTRPEGTGIGLSLVQRIVDQHNGVIALKSEEGQGSTFYLTLPLKVAKGKG